MNPPSTENPLDNVRVRFAFRNFVPFRDREWWDGLIFAGQGCKSPVHSEVIQPDGKILTATWDEGICYVQRDYSAERGWWQFRDVFIPLDAAHRAMQWAASEIAAKEDHNKLVDLGLVEGPKWGYDKHGVLRFAISFEREHPSDWFCSETSVRWGIEAGIFAESLVPWQINPYQLDGILAANGASIVEE